MSKQWQLALVACLALLVIPIGVWLWLDDDAPRSSGAGQAETQPVVEDEEPASEGGARILHGRVVDLDGAPIAEASVRIAEHQGMVTTTDGSGRFTLMAAPLEAVDVVATAPGYERVVEEVAAGSAGDRTEVSITLEVAAAIRGLVLSPDGEPVGRATVTCIDREEDAPWSQSDGEGAFSLRSDADGCMAVARHGEFVESEPLQMKPGDGNDLRLREAGSIAGSVESEDGQPLPRFSVAVESYKPASDASPLARRKEETVRDGRGDFALTGLQAGSYVLTASAAGYPPVSTDTIELAAGERIRGISITLRRGALLSGRVVDGDGRPVPNARVSLDGFTTVSSHRVRPAQTDPEGHFELDGVPPGPFSIRVSAEGFDARVIAGIETRGRDQIEQDVTLSAAEGDTKTEYTGIGAMLAERSEGVAIMRVIDGGPAEAAGVKAGDVIKHIDGDDARGFTIPQAVQLLRGPPGTSVSLDVRRGSRELRFVIVREAFSN